MIRIFIISGLFWVIALVIYQVLLRKFTFHHLNRWYLILSMIIGAVLPFLPLSSGQEQPLIVYLNPVVIQMNGLTSTLTTQVATQVVDYGIIIGLVYIMGVCFHFFKLSRGISTLLQHANSSSIVNRNGVQVVSSPQISQPFSFWKWVFVPEQDSTDPIILDHEHAHIKGGHSLDKLLIQLLAAVYWVLPVFIIYRRFINEVHEYIADSYVLRKTSKKKYSYFLLGQTGQGVTPLLSNNFHSLIKNRITMILKKESNRYSRLWYLPVMVLMLGLASVILTACDENQPNEPISVAEENAESISKLISFTDTIITFSPETYEESVKYVTTKLDVFDKLDQMPLFSLEGCDGNTDKEELQDCADLNMLQFIYENIKYPKDKSQEGVVVLKFIVSKEGYAVHPEVVRTIGKEYTDAVMTMYHTLAKHQWVPGQLNGEAKNVFMHLPIKFKLE